MSNKEKTDLLEFLRQMISKFPNDQELGKEIRKYFLSKTESTKTK
jgi:hypothetical protein